MEFLLWVFLALSWGGDPMATEAASVQSGAVAYFDDGIPPPRGGK